jgi:hypothetical protein
MRSNSSLEIYVPLIMNIFRMRKKIRLESIRKVVNDDIRWHDCKRCKFSIINRREIHPRFTSDLDGDGIPDTQDAFPNDPDEWEDTDGDGTGNNADTDDDNDNMLDTWEETYNGLDPLFDDSNGDLDGDGITNLQEYLDGSNPVRNSIWVDFTYTVTESGTQAQPCGNKGTTFRESVYIFCKC